MILGYIVLGIVIWQTVLAIYLFTQPEDSDAYYMASIGIWTIILSIVRAIVDTIKLYFHRKKYNLYGFYTIGGTTDLARYWTINYAMTPKNAEQFRQYPEYDDYFIKLIKEGREFKTPLDKHEIISFNKLTSWQKKFLKGSNEK